MIVVDTEFGHTTPADAVWFGRLKFCGCGQPEQVMRRMKDVMRCMANRSNALPASLEAYSILTDELWEKAGPDNISRYLLLYILDAAGLEEHGGSVPGWLTEDGEELLTFLENTPEENWFGNA